MQAQDTGLRLAIGLLGVTQIIGYGTLYYSFGILAPSIAAHFDWPTSWVFGALSLALLAGGLIAPFAGRWIDRYGAGRIMTVGSLIAALALVLGAFAPGPIAFVASLVLIDIAGTLVQYPAAFALLVQLGPRRAQRNIVYLTLIAGFASTIFWPVTAALHARLSWQEVFLAYAALHVALCMPMHFWLSRHGRQRASATAEPTPSVKGSVAARNRTTVFALMVTGFALESFVNAAVLMHMVPMLGTLGLGAAAVLIGTVFGPAQVLSRLINMIFGGELSQVRLAVITAALLPVALLILIGTAPTLTGGLVFAVVFGLGSGLMSIVQGTLPLALFGSAGYGSRIGQMTSARLVASSAAPFGFALLAERSGIFWTLSVMTALGAAAIVAFVAIALLLRRAAREAAAAPAAMTP